MESIDKDELTILEVLPIDAQATGIAGQSDSFELAKRWPELEDWLLVFIQVPDRHEDIL